MAGAKQTVALPALVAGALLLAAGCGGGGGTKGAATTAAATTTQASTAPLAKAAYVRQMRTIGRSLSTSLNTLGKAKTAATAATALAAVQGDLRAAADRLDSIDPPAPVEAEHAALVKAVRDFADELGPVIAKLKKGDLTALSAVPSLKGLTEVQSASTAITSKGYNIAG